MDLDTYKELVNQIRGEEPGRREPVLQIPQFLALSGKQKQSPQINGDTDATGISQKLLDQLLLLLYNLNTPKEKFERLNANNRILIIRHLLRLYVQSNDSHSHQQMLDLKEFVRYSKHSPELLIELAHTFHQCRNRLAEPEKTKIVLDEAMDSIFRISRIALYSDVLLMIISIKASI